MSENEKKELSDEQLTDVSGGAHSNHMIWYTVTKGDTLEKIAIRFRTTVQEILEINKQIRNNYIRPGFTILVPFK